MMKQFFKWTKLFVVLMAISSSTVFSATKTEVKALIRA